MQEKYYVIECYDHEWGVSYDELWGSDSRVYRTREEAERHVATLNECEWEIVPPEYAVEEWTVRKILKDPHLRKDLLTLERSDPIAAALEEKSAETEMLYTQIRILSDECSKIGFDAEAMARALCNLYGACKNGAYGEAVSVADARMCNRWPLAQDAVAPITRLANELDAMMENITSRPRVIAVTPDLKHALVYHVTHKREPLDGWWRVEDMRKRLDGDDSVTPMTDDECMAIGVWMLQ